MPAQSETAAPRVGATALLGALSNVADNVKLFRLLLAELPRDDRGTWEDALGKLLEELQTSASVD